MHRIIAWVKIGYYAVLPGAALSVAPRPSVFPSVPRLSPYLRYRHLSLPHQFTPDLNSFAPQILSSISFLVQFRLYVSAELSEH